VRDLVEACGGANVVCPPLEFVGFEFFDTSTAATAQVVVVPDRFTAPIQRFSAVCSNYVDFVVRRQAAQVVVDGGETDRSSSAH
jgi:hypothetical protein